MRAKQGHRYIKMDSPFIGNWLKRYWAKKTCRRRARRSYRTLCKEHDFRPQFSYGRGIITAEMAAKMDCPWSDDSDL